MQPRPHEFDPTQPFTRADALAAGVSRRALMGPRFTRVLYDVHVASSVEVTPSLRARVAIDLCGGRGHASHHTAAAIWELWVPEEADVHVSVRTRTERRKRRGLKSHLAHRSAKVVVHRGVRVSSPLQTFLELARLLSLVDLVVLGDSIVHRGLATPAELERAAAAWRGHGAVLARRAASLVREGVESPMETRLRLLLVLAGLPEPRIAQTITRPDGRRRIRFDLSFPGYKVAVEYDGRQHAESEDQWLHDLGRREDLDELAWRLVIVTARGIYVEPDVTLDRVVRALHERGATHLRVAADDEWRRHFPGRRLAA